MQVNRFPTFRFFPSDIAYLRFVLSEVSTTPFKFEWDAIRSVLKELWNSVGWIGWGGAKLLAGLLIAKKTEKFLALQIHELCITGAGMQLGLRRSDIPTPKKLLSMSFSVVLSHAVCYPATTVMVRIANNTLKWKDVPALFSNWESFLQLYKGIGYHLVWMIIYQLVESIDEYYRQFWEDSYGNKSIILHAGIRVLSLGFLPLQIKALYDQAYPLRHNLICWPPLYQFLTTYGLEIFRK